MCRILLFVLLLTGYLPLVGGASNTNIPDYYEWITALSSGPIKWKEGITENDTSGERYRVVITTSEIYNSVYLEKISIGPEGCCVQLQSIQNLNLNNLKVKFGLKGEIAGFKLIEWETFNVFIFTIHSRTFKAQIAENSEVEIEEISR